MVQDKDSNIDLLKETSKNKILNKDNNPFDVAKDAQVVLDSLIIRKLESEHYFDKFLIIGVDDESIEDVKNYKICNVAPK